MQTETKLEPSPDVYREAAWAAVSILIGLPPAPARLLPASNRNGTSLSSSRPRDRRLPRLWEELSDHAKAEFEARAVAILVGGAAEENVTRGHEMSQGQACLYDGLAIYEVLADSGGLSPADARAAVVRLTKQARAVLANPDTWAAVTRVAEALASTRQLSAEEVACLVRGEAPN